MVSKPSSLLMRRTISTGTEAAPVTATRKELRSYSWRCGWLRIDWYSVGGPGSTVIFSRAMRSSSTGTSNTCCGRMQQPRISAASQPAL
ncbi:hypothetical protein D3C78_1062550 [compost metagenome]